MTTTSETELKELKDLINSQFGQLDKKISDLDKKIDIGITQLDKKIDVGITQLDKKVDVSITELNKKIDLNITQLSQKIDIGITEIKGDMRRIEDKLDAKIEGIDKRLTDLNNKVDKLEGRVNVEVNWFLGIITGLVSVLLTALVKLIFFPFNNP